MGDCSLKKIVTVFCAVAGIILVLGGAFLIFYLAPTKGLSIVYRWISAISGLMLVVMGWKWLSIRFPGSMAKIEGHLRRA
jgi:uncharacterized membrane protein